MKWSYTSVYCMSKQSHTHARVLMCCTVYQTANWGRQKWRVKASRTELFFRSEIVDFVYEHNGVGMVEWCWWCCWWRQRKSFGKERIEVQTQLIQKQRNQQFRCIRSCHIFEWEFYTYLYSYIGTVLIFRIIIFILIDVKLFKTLINDVETEKCFSSKSAYADFIFVCFLCDDVLCVRCVCDVRAVNVRFSGKD